MTDDRWPQIGPEDLKRLWEQHAPGFIPLADVEVDLPQMRDKFLQWLDSRGVDLGKPSAGPDPRDTRGPRGRVKLDGVGYTRRGIDAEAQVSMTLGENSSEARRKGPAIPDEILRLSAETTLDAVNELVPGFAFGLETVFTVDPTYAEESVAVVVVRNFGRLSERFVGACQVSASMPEAAAKATLQAINRRTAS